MIKILTQLSQKLALNSRTIFLFDGLGALLSTLLLVLLLAPLENIFGLSKQIIYQLAIPTSIFTIYSLTLYVLNVKAWRLFLILIASANFLYCCVTFGLVIQKFSSLTSLGIAYFLSEVLTIFLVISLEIIIIKQSD